MAQGLHPRLWNQIFWSRSPDLKGHFVDTPKLHNNNRLALSRSWDWMASLGLVFLVLVMLPATSEAQHHSDSVREYIERTEELLI